MKDKAGCVAGRLLQRALALAPAVADFCKVSRTVVLHLRIRCLSCYLRICHSGTSGIPVPLKGAAGHAHVWSGGLEPG